MGKIKGWTRTLNSKFEAVYRSDDFGVASVEDNFEYLPHMTRLIIGMDDTGMWITIVESNMQNFNPNAFSIHNQPFMTKQEGLDAMFDWMRSTKISEGKRKEFVKGQGYVYV